MDIFEFLQTPAGLQITQALTVLAVAIAGYITWLTHRDTSAVKQTVESTSDKTNKILGHVDGSTQDVVAGGSDGDLRQ